MARAIELLIVSSRLENRGALMRILDGLPLDVLAAGNVEQAEEVLERGTVDVVLCDERLSDGTYHDVLALTIDRAPKIHFIVMMCSGGIGEYREAMQLGVSEVVRFPLQPTDVELALIHAMRRQPAAAHAAA
jgi:DNA-binding NtrC family response regulator